MSGGVRVRVSRFKPALISKGLRPIVARSRALSPSFKPALISKGLRPLRRGAVARAQPFQTSPDFKGIKTALRLFQYLLPFRFKPALISKGLRRASFYRFRSNARFKPALISKGLRPKCPKFPRALAGFQTSPDFKGIKTPEYWRFSAPTNVSNQP